MKYLSALLLLCALACTQSKAPALHGLIFRAQCYEEDEGALETVVQGISAWFGPARSFPIAAYHPAQDAQGHPAIRVELEASAHAAFEAYTIAGVAGPIGLFLDGELIAVPSIQPIGNGRFTFCNQAGGWTAADRDRWLQRLRASQEG